MSNLPWYQRPPFRTFTFWFCVVGCWFDITCAFITRRIPELTGWSGYWLFFASVFAFGAATHWGLDRYYRWLFAKEKARRPLKK